jgi:hypothetical protein
MQKVRRDYGQEYWWGRVSLLRLQGLFDGTNRYTVDRVSDLLSA